MLLIQREGGKTRMEAIMKLIYKWARDDHIILLTVVVTLSVVMIARSSVLGYGFIEVGTDFSPGGTYALLDQLLSLRTWGVLHCINAVLYLIGIILIFRRQTIWLLAFCGLLGGVLMFFYVAASWENSTTKIHTFGYIITLSLHFFIAFLGGVAAWLKKSETSSHTNI